MKLDCHEFGRLKVYCRSGTSDLKTFKEVIGKGAYEKRGNKIETGEHWYDCGANVGAFSLLALSKGATVEAFEPDPFNCEILELNVKRNNFKCAIHQVALVHNDKKEATLFSGKNGNYWRNSLLKNWDGKGLKVPCRNFESAVVDGACVKMDIEGAEMPIIESTKRVFKKLIFEWSFDIDPDLNRYRRVIESLKNSYEVRHNSYPEIYDTWPKNWFPACTNVFCSREL